MSGATNQERDKEKMCLVATRGEATRLAGRDHGAGRKERVEQSSRGRRNAMRAHEKQREIVEKKPQKARGEGNEQSRMASEAENVTQIGPGAAPPFSFRLRHPEKCRDA